MSNSNAVASSQIQPTININGDAIATLGVAIIAFTTLAREVMKAGYEFELKKGDFNLALKKPQAIEAADSQS